MRQDCALGVDLPVRPSLQDLVQGDSTLEAGHRRSEAEVQAIAEAHVMANLAMDVEAIAVSEPAMTN
jgi:hypothetical protein